jgi:Short C-terminal domain
MPEVGKDTDVKPGPEEQEARDPPPTSEPEFDPIEQLRELGELREQGILTEEEFTAEKKKLLG